MFGGARKLSVDSDFVRLGPRVDHSFRKLLWYLSEFAEENVPTRLAMK